MRTRGVWGRTLTGAWIETNDVQVVVGVIKVAPSRVRGLKPVRNRLARDAISRTLTGAWIETSAKVNAARRAKSRTLTGAWIETTQMQDQGGGAQSRTLTGAWIETNILDRSYNGIFRSHPHGCVD